MAPNSARTWDLELAFPPVPTSAGAARRALSAQGLAPSIEHTVLLLTTEMVSNAVRHGDLAPNQPIVLAVHLGPGCAHVEVTDAGRGFDPRTVVSDGYGLKLLERLAAHWAVECNDAGCCVWFEVGRCPDDFARGLPGAYQPFVPDGPLNGPHTSAVIQPP